MYACGSGDAGELGDGSTASHATPTRVVGLPAGEKVTALASSWEGSGALLANGSYYDWGYNQAGQLGDHSTSDSARPVKVDLPDPSPRSSTAAAAEERPDDRHPEGQLNLRVGGQQRRPARRRHDDNSDTPIRLQVQAGVTFTTVSSAGFATYAIDSHGWLWDRGSNSEGQLGLGSSVSMKTRPTNAGIQLTQVSSTAQDVAGLESRR